MAVDTSQYVNATAVDVGGVKIGTVLAVTDSADGAGAGWLTIGTGVLGTHEVHVPLAGTAVRDGEVVVPFAKSSVDESPAVSGWQTMTPEEAARLTAHYKNAATPEPTDPLADAPAGTVGSAVTVTRSEELLHVGVERVVSKVVRVSKYRVTETVTRTFQVSHEEIRVDTLPAHGPAQPAGFGGRRPDADGSRNFEVVLHAEQLVVTKHVVPVERVRITVDDVVQQVQVSESVRKETLELTGVDGSPRPLGNSSRANGSKQPPDD